MKDEGEEVDFTLMGVATVVAKEGVMASEAVGDAVVVVILSEEALGGDLIFVDEVGDMMEPETTKDGKWPFVIRNRPWK